MKTISVLFAMLITTVFQAQVQEHELKNEGTIKVLVSNISSDEGKVLFALHTEDTFMKTDAIDRARSEIKDGVASVTFNNVKPGTYAILCFHDKNDNEKMDFDANGMPQESYGSSNNPMQFGPPQWSDSKFEFTGEDQELEIRF